MGHAAVAEATESPSIELEAHRPRAAARAGKELMDATKPFASENVARSWAHVLVGFGVLAVALVGAVTLGSWPLALASSVAAGLTVVRIFIFYHDHMHGSLLRHSKPAQWLLRAFGLLVLTPPNVWRDTHNYHHAHTAQLIGSHIGSYAMVTTEMWKQLTPSQKRKYKIVRHPLTILFAYVPVFMIGMCVSSLQKSVRKYWDSALALAINVALSVALPYAFGWRVAVLGYFVPLFVACMVGAYLFYAQHNFPDVVIRPRQKWSYASAALEASSFMPMGPVMQWFTGNIGFHHVHHLNSNIPFYRLPEAMAAIPELQQPGKTSLSPADIYACFTLKLWDASAGRMVGYPKE
jgi:omega-6 fatty acid desaturase (delta-12 desaturase)